MFSNSKSKRKKTNSYKKVRVECSRRIKKKKKKIGDSITLRNLRNWDYWASQNDSFDNKELKLHKIQWVAYS